MEDKTVQYWIILFLVRLVEVPFLVAAMCLYAEKFRKRGRFKARLAGYVCIVVAALLLTDLMYASVLTNYLLSQIGSVLYILVRFFGMFLLYREDWKKIITAYVLVYLSSFMTNAALTLIFTCCGVDWTTEIPYMLYFLAAEAALEIIYIFPLYYIYIKRIRDCLSGDMDGWVIMLLLYSIIITVVMDAVREGYVGMYSYDIKPINIFLLVFIILNSLFAMYACYIYLKGRASAREKEVINTMWKQDKARYEVRKENIAALNIKSHDIKNYLSKARFRGREADEFAEEVERVVQRYDSDIHTGNDALDVILSEHSAYCSTHGITLKCQADGPVLSGMSEPDIYTLFDNILLNSTEYLSTVDDPDKRICFIEVKKAKGMVLIHQENYFAGTLPRAGGEIQTTKEDTVNHGYGLKSIRAIAEKYGGGMTVRDEGGFFRLNIMMPCPNS